MLTPSSPNTGTHKCVVACVIQSECIKHKTSLMRSPAGDTWIKWTQSICLTYMDFFYCWKLWFWWFQQETAEQFKVSSTVSLAFHTDWLCGRLNKLWNGPDLCLVQGRDPNETKDERTKPLKSRNTKSEPVNPLKLNNRCFNIQTNTRRQFLKVCNVFWLF